MKDLILNLEEKSIFNNKLAFVRSILAFGSLLLIAFNNIEEMTNFEIFQVEANSMESIYLMKQASIFNLFDSFIAKLISIIILLFVFSGYFPQVSSLLQTWVHLSICNSFVGVDGGDQIASNLSLLLIPICIFDNRINQWSVEKPINSVKRKAVNVFFNVYFYLIFLQVAIIYFHSGIGKLYSSEWRDGTCIYFWFTDNVFGAPIWLQKIYSIVTLSNFTPLFTWLIIIIELGLFCCILATNKKIKKTFLILGLSLHFFIAITHGLITFFFSMAAALILYLDEENTTLNFLKTIKTLRK